MSISKPSNQSKLYFQKVECRNSLCDWYARYFFYQISSALLFLLLLAERGNSRVVVPSTTAKKKTGEVPPQFTYCVYCTCAVAEICTVPYCFASPRSHAATRRNDSVLIGVLIGRVRAGSCVHSLSPLSSSVLRRRARSKVERAVERRKKSPFVIFSNVKSTVS